MDSFKFCSVLLILWNVVNVSLSEQVIDVELEDENVKVLTPGYDSSQPATLNPTKSFSASKVVFCHETYFTSIPKNTFVVFNDSAIYDFQECKLKSIKKTDFVGAYEQIFEMSFSDNEISELPNEVFTHLARLETLDLNKNQITKLYPDSLKGLSNIKILELSSNPISSIPQGFFSNIRTLQSLDLSNTLIESLPEDVFADINDLSILRLENCKINYVHPNALLHLKPSLVLTIQNNNFDELHLRAAQSVKAGMSNLKVLEVKEKVHELIAPANQLTSIDVGELSEIQVLILNDNQITDISKLRDAKKLRNLDLSNNPLTPIPAGFFSEMSRLRQLGLSNVNLGDLSDPNFFAGLSSLESVNLSGNPITNINVEIFANMKHLKRVMFGDVTVPQELIDSLKNAKVRVV